MQDLAIGHELTKSTQSYIPHPYLLEIAIQADVLQSSEDGGEEEMHDGTTNSRRVG